MGRLEPSDDSMLQIIKHEQHASLDQPGLRGFVGTLCKRCLRGKANEEVLECRKDCREDDKEECDADDDSHEDRGSSVNFP